VTERAPEAAPAKDDCAKDAAQSAQSRAALLAAHSSRPAEKISAGLCSNQLTRYSTEVAGIETVSVPKWPVRAASDSKLLTGRDAAKPMAAKKTSTRIVDFDCDGSFLIKKLLQSSLLS
jgi:hypothetical protein